MARPTWTLTGPLSAPHGAVLAGTELTLSLVPGVSRDPSGSDLRAGSTVAVVGPDGTLTVKGTGDPVTLLASAPGAPVHYRLSCIPRVLPSIVFAAPEGGSLALDDIVPEVPIPIPAVDASTLRAEWQAALAAALADLPTGTAPGASETVVSPTQGTITLTPVHDCTHVLTLTGDATVTLDPAPGGTTAALAVTYAGHSLTVDGTAYTAGLLVLHYYGGVWHVTPAGESVATPVPDVTPPTAGALTASALTASSVTLTVTGAADETALHATPYAFSLDGGLTWLPWQASATYTAAVAQSTTYTAAHRVRDAAGNVTAGTPITVTTPAAADTTAPTSPALTVDATSQTQLVATVTGGTDNVGVTQRRVRIDGGAWEVLTVATTKTFTGLTASSSHTIDAQAGDAAGNWSTSTSWSGSTAAPAVTATSPTDLAGLYYHFDLADPATVTVASGAVTKITTASRGTAGSTLSGAGAALDSASAATITTVSVNGLPAVRIPAATKIGTSSFPSPQPSFAAGATVFHVFKATAAPGASANWVLANLPQAGIGQGGYDTWRADGMGVAVGAVSDTNTTAGQTYVQVTTNDGAGTVKIWRSNWSTPYIATGRPAPGTHYFTDFGGGSLTADHCQWGVYDRALSAGEVTSLMAWLKTRWGVA